MPGFVQREVLRDTAAVAFGQTYELDLPKSGLLMGLVLYLRANAASAALDTIVKWRLCDYISKIEVIADGSEIIKSYDGRQALASAFYDDFRLPSTMERTYTTTSQRQWIPIHFGRGFLDEIYGLDLSKYNQVTLKITNDAHTDYWQTRFNLDVVAYWLRENPNPFYGHFREEEWKVWKPAAGGMEYNQLPLALPIRRILLRGRPFVGSADSKQSSSFGRCMDVIEFTFRSGQTRVYNGSLDQLGHLAIMEMPALVECRGSCNKSTGYAFETGVGYVQQNLGYGQADAGGDLDNLANMSKDVQNSAQEMAYNSGQGPLAYVVRGFGYQHCLPLFYARKPDLDDLLDPEAVKQVALNIQCQSGTTVDGTGTDAENAIILSRLVR